ncbi:papilin-like [Planococcus citri]|uniref:papilin-like n=1 Tax=Planococcus citri TaxID=170843 RepID=UPI0031F85630
MSQSKSKTVYQPTLKRKIEHRLLMYRALGCVICDGVIGDASKADLNSTEAVCGTCGHLYHTSCLAPVRDSCETNDNDMPQCIVEDCVGTISNEDLRVVGGIWREFPRVSSDEYVRLVEDLDDKKREIARLRDLVEETEKLVAEKDEAISSYESILEDRQSKIDELKFELDDYIESTKPAAKRVVLRSDAKADVSKADALKKALTTVKQAPVVKASATTTKTTVTVVKPNVTTTKTTVTVVKPNAPTAKPAVMVASKPKLSTATSSTKTTAPAKSIELKTAQKSTATAAASTDTGADKTEDAPKETLSLSYQAMEKPAETQSVTTKSSAAPKPGTKKPIFDIEAVKARLPKVTLTKAQRKDSVPQSEAAVAEKTAKKRHAEAKKPKKSKLRSEYTLEELKAIREKDARQHRERRALKNAKVSVKELADCGLDQTFLSNLLKYVSAGRDATKELADEPVRGETSDRESAPPLHGVADEKTDAIARETEADVQDASEQEADAQDISEKDADAPIDEPIAEATDTVEDSAATGANETNGEQACEPTARPSDETTDNTSTEAAAEIADVSGTSDSEPDSSSSSGSPSSSSSSDSDTSGNERVPNRRLSCEKNVSSCPPTRPNTPAPELPIDNGDAPMGDLPNEPRQDEEQPADVLNEDVDPNLAREISEQPVLAPLLPSPEHIQVTLFDKPPIWLNAPVTRRNFSQYVTAKGIVLDGSIPDADAQLYQPVGERMFCFPKWVRDDVVYYSLNGYFPLGEALAHAIVHEPMRHDSLEAAEWRCHPLAGSRIPVFSIRKNLENEVGVVPTKVVLAAGQKDMVKGQVEKTTTKITALFGDLYLRGCRHIIMLPLITYQGCETERYEINRWLEQANSKFPGSYRYASELVPIIESCRPWSKKTGLPYLNPHQHYEILAKVAELTIEERRVSESTYLARGPLPRINEKSREDSRSWRADQVEKEMDRHRRGRGNRQEGRGRGREQRG